MTSTDDPYGHGRQILATLTVYAYRAQTALEQMHDGHWDAAVTWLKRHRAAFCNLRTAWELSSESTKSWVLSQGHEAMQAAMDLDKKLQRTIVMWQDRCHQELTKVHGGRQSLAKFHSGHGLPQGEPRAVV